ncbi:glycosyltransferase family 2 protein [Autumnicola psychrophila]|uniref:Glycosyltransferase n=1 Tax=Autumnicola psychrophila TaxID=3075592 RepID=A0ABU3DT31_9FLAO|nr:glycosyltransferase [Zunongwangia sp. F225]MDT0686845.1 glycosyltransferase [Zunongwangia sp. F225]
MEASVLIVSNNRSAELHRTLKVLQEYLIFDRHEILVLLDGCTDDSEKIIELYPQVKWEISEGNLGASKARSILYSKAKGKILFGFDDDAHPLQKDFIKISEKLFARNPNVGIIAFKEIKGIFESDDDIPQYLKQKKDDYLVKDFLGCGFAIKKDIYNRTRGFPIWIDIYGEEVCVAMETLELGYDLLFTYQVAVNHRTQRQKKNIAGANYFRFGKQLKNTASFYLVYYPFPLVLKKIGRLYISNFQKYALKDFRFLKEYFKALGLNILNLKNILSYRKPVSEETIKRFNKLSNPSY